MLTAGEMLLSDGVENEPCGIKRYGPDCLSGYRLCRATDL